MRKVWVVPVMHPAAILRGQWALEPAQVRTLQRAKQIASEGGWPHAADMTAPLVPTVLEPTIADLYQFLPRIGPQGIGVDIECAGPHLTCVGFATIDEPMHALVLPFRRQGGALYWPWQQHVAAVKWLYELLANAKVPKVFHNGQAFDVPYLEELGFTVRGYEDDTMLMQHTAYAEMPKALEWCATMYLGMPPWKWMAGEGEEGK